MNRLKVCTAAVLLMIAAGANAQSAAEISAAKSMARQYGYSDTEINAVLNHNIGGTTSAAAVTSGTTTAPAAAVTAEVTDVTVIEAAAPEEQPTTGSNIYGHDYFTSKGLSVIPSYNAPVPASYVLGPGDEIVIDVWGSTNSHVVATIGNDGSISAFDLGPVYLSGMTVDKAESYLKNQLSRIYSGLSTSNGETNLRLSVGKIKGVVVNITGEVAVPGAYTIPSLSSITSAIFMAGGVTDNASVRNIALYRAGRKVSSFDLYAFIFKGKLDQNTRLQDGDIINVEPYSNVVSISGAITRPMRYEMKADETIEDLIVYAGGFKTDARKDEVNVTRVNGNGSTGESNDVKKGAFASFKLKDADEVSVRSTPKVLANRVTLGGNVVYPGSYAISGKISNVKELISAAGGLREGAYMERGQIERLDDNLLTTYLSFDLKKVMDGTEIIPLVREDKVTIFSQTDFTEDLNVTVTGYVTEPGTFTFHEGMTTADAIVLAHGIRMDAYKGRGQINRTDEDGSQIILSFNVQAAIDGTEAIPLKRGDEVRIFSRRELLQDATVTISGEVTAPQTFTYRDGMTLMDLVMMAGGFTNGADLTNLEIATRGGRERGEVMALDVETDASALEYPLKPYDAVSVRRLTFFKPQTTVTVDGEVITPGTYVVDKAEVRLSDVLARVGGFTEEAYIHGARLTRMLTEEEQVRQETAVMIANQNRGINDTIDVASLQDHYSVGIELDKALDKPGSKYDIVLRAGDIISVPAYNSTVKISGGVFYPNVVQYDQRAGWRAYVAQAGGFTKLARKRKTYAIHLNGKVSTVRHGMSVEPGSEIVVPERQDKDRSVSPAEIAALASSATSLIYLITAFTKL